MAQDPGDYVTLPVAFLAMLLEEDERIGPRSEKDPTPHWYGQRYDEGYVLRGRAATPEEVAAQATLDDALAAHYLGRSPHPPEPGGGGR